MNESVRRSAIVAEAKSWLNTPYRGHAAIKGVGADCATILRSVYVACGEVEALTLDHYALQWTMNQKEERYISEIERFGAREISEEQAGAGDIVVYRIGYTFSHGGIIIEWPGMVLHAMERHGVIYSHGTDEGFLTRRKRRFFSMFSE